MRPNRSCPIGSWAARMSRSIDFELREAAAGRVVPGVERIQEAHMAARRGTSGAIIEAGVDGGAPGEDEPVRAGVVLVGGVGAVTAKQTGGAHDPLGRGGAGCRAGARRGRRATSGRRASSRGPGAPRSG